MATVNPKTFPGVYTSITDDSFVQPAASRFRPGLIGVATKGPFNTPTSVRSLKEFRELFGEPLTTTYQNDGSPSGAGFFLADAVAMIADMTDGIVVVRVGSQYDELPVQDVSGNCPAVTISARANTICSPRPPIIPFTSRSPKAASPARSASRVIAVGNGTVSLDTSGDALAASYLDATVAFSHESGAANKAESILYAYSYGTSSAAIRRAGDIGRNDHWQQE
jgi:hypothetical protein